MKNTKNEEYERTQLTITEFDRKDRIITSGNYGQNLYETPGAPDTDW